MCAAGRAEEWCNNAAAGTREGMERNVARLFQERGMIFGEVDLTQASVLAGARTCLHPHLICPIPLLMPLPRLCPSHTTDLLVLDLITCA